MVLIENFSNYLKINGELWLNPNSKGFQIPKQNSYSNHQWKHLNNITWFWLIKNTYKSYVLQFLILYTQPLVQNRITERKQIIGHLFVQFSLFLVRQNITQCFFVCLNNQLIMVFVLDVRLNCQSSYKYGHILLAHSSRSIAVF